MGDKDICRSFSLFLPLPGMDRFKGCSGASVTFSRVNLDVPLMPAAGGGTWWGSSRKGHARAELVPKGHNSAAEVLSVFGHAQTQMAQFLRGYAVRAGWVARIGAGREVRLWLGGVLPRGHAGVGGCGADWSIVCVHTGACGADGSGCSVSGRPDGQTHAGAAMCRCPERYAATC